MGLLGSPNDDTESRNEIHYVDLKVIRKIAYHIQSVRNWHCYILFVAMFPQPSLFEKPGTQSVIILPVYLTYVVHERVTRPYLL